MSILFLVIGLLFCSYYVYLAAIAGHVLGVALFWLIGGIVFLALAEIFYLGKRRPGKRGMPLFLRVFILTSVVIVMGVLIFLSVLVVRGMDQEVWDDEPEYVLVLGAALHEDQLGEFLRGRLDTAITYQRIHPEVKIIVSGGHTGGPTSEAVAMRTYLTSHGVSRADIITENSSVTTEENFRYSLNIINNDAPHGIIVITNDFHMFRALSIGRKMTDVTLYGYPVRSDIMEMPYHISYEVLATLKAWVLGSI